MIWSRNFFIEKRYLALKVLDILCRYTCNQRVSALSPFFFSLSFFLYILTTLHIPLLSFYFHSSLSGPRKHSTWVGDPSNVLLWAVIPHLMAYAYVRSLYVSTISSCDWTENIYQYQYQLIPTFWPMFTLLLVCVLCSWVEQECLFHGILGELGSLC